MITRAAIRCLLPPALLLGAGASVAAAPAGAPDLSGDWSIEWVAANLVRIPILGNTLVLTRQSNTATVRWSGERWIQHHVPCSLAAESNSPLASTFFPPAFVNAIPEKTYRVDLRESQGAWLYAADLGPLAVGFDRALRAQGIPSERDDPSIIDWDGDGHPGATVEIRAPVFGRVEVYLVQASHSRLSGTVTVDATGRAVAVDGSFELAEMGQRTIGASNRLFLTNPTLTFQPHQSRFHMVRLSSGAACGGVVPDGDTVVVD